MSFILCTSGAIVYKAGANVSTLAAASGAILEQFSDEAEGRICAETKYDWLTNYSSIKASFKPILADAASGYAAAMLVAYDMSGYTTRGEGEDVVNMNMDRFQKAVALLKEDKIKTKMGATNS